MALGTWRDDRSYLWSVFVGGMATAAVAPGRPRVCAELLAELEPVDRHLRRQRRAGLLHGQQRALGRHARRRAGPDATTPAAGCAGADVHRGSARGRGRPRPASSWPLLGVTAARRDGPRELAASSACTASTARLAGQRGRGPATDAELRRDGELWRVAPPRRAPRTCATSRGSPTSPCCSPGPARDVHVLELAGAGPHDRTAGALLDATARAAYRRRLAELDDDLAAARATTTSAACSRLDDAARRADRRAAPGRRARRPRPAARREHHRARPQGRYRPAARGDPPHRGRAPRARRAPRPVGAHRHDLPLRPCRTPDLAAVADVPRQRGSWSRNADHRGVSRRSVTRSCRPATSQTETSDVAWVTKNGGGFQLIMCASRCTPDRST